MNISVQTLLKKMEQELQDAQKSGSESKIRERVHAIKSLCELILGENSTSTNQPQVITSVQNNPMQNIAPQSIQPASLQTKPMKMDDNSNGDSLFDF